MTEQAGIAKAKAEIREDLAHVLDGRAPPSWECSVEEGMDMVHGLRSGITATILEWAGPIAFNSCPGGVRGDVWLDRCVRYAMAVMGR